MEATVAATIPTAAEGQLIMIGRGLVRYDMPYLPGTPEWLAQHATVIGGSDAPGVMGYGDPRYHSKARVWASKVGTPDPLEDRPELSLGGAMEPYIAKALAERLGTPVHDCRYFVQHADLPVFGVDVDGYVVENGIEIPVEMKCKWERFKQADDVDALEAAILDPDQPWPSHTVAEANWCQLQAAMAVTGAPYGYLVFVIGPWAALKLRELHDCDDRELRVLKVPAFEALTSAFVPCIGAFWRDHVEARVCPPDVGTEDAAALLSAWRVAQAGKVVEVEGIAAAAEQLRQAQDAAKSARAELEPLEDEVKRLKAVLVSLLQDAESGREGIWTVSAKTIAKASYVVEPKPYRDVRIKNSTDKKGK